MAALMNVVDTRLSVMVRLPCKHQRARLAGREQAVRRCGHCRRWWLIDFYTRELATCTDITCAVCGGELGSMGDMWTCKSCGAEWDDTQVRG